MTTATLKTSADTRSTLPDFLTRIAGGVVGYISRSRAERQLEALDDRLLADIGLKRSDIRQMVWGSEVR